MSSNIQGNNVVTTVTTPIPQYVKNIQGQISMLQKNIASREKQTLEDTAKITQLVASLSALVS